MIQQFISKLSPQEKKILYAFAVVSILALFDHLLLRPAMSQLKSLDVQIQQDESNIKKDMRFLSYKNRILDEEDHFRFYLVKKGLTEEEIIASFLKKIEILATEADVVLIKVSPTESEQKKGYKKYYAVLECSGQLKNVIHFIHLMDSADELMKTTELNMLPKKGAGDEVTTEIKVAKVILESLSSDKKKFEQDGSVKAQATKEGDMNTGLTIQTKKGTGKVVQDPFVDVKYSQE